MADTQAQSSTQASEAHEQTGDQQSDARARAKGKQVVVEQEEIDIMNLKPSDLGKPLDLKVYRKWISKNIPDPSPTGICFMLLDKKGGAIQAMGQLPDMRQLDTRLQLDGCYRIQGYGCKRTDNWQRTLDNRVTLLFGRYTQAAPIQDEGFPKHYFSFAAYNEVCHRADTREPILTDYIGMIRNIGTIREFGDTTTNIISRRNIEIQNLNGNVVMLTLWNELATGFPITRLDEMDQPVITSASSCWAKRHAGVIQLSTTPATAIYLNPEIPEADHIEEAYKELVGSTPSMQPRQIQALDVEDQGQLQIMTLARIMESASHNITQQHFTTDAVVVKIDESRGCYCFRATLADVTGSIVVACYSPAAHSLVPNITELLSYVPDKDPYMLPPIIKDLENTKRRFRIHVGKGSRRGYPNFILDHATDVPTPLFGETPSTPEEATSSTTASHHITEEEPTEITPGTSSPPSIAATPIQTILRITGPPDDTQVQATEISEDVRRGPISTSSERPAETGTTSQEAEHGTARRQLFRESHEEEVDESLKKARHD
ncbi:nucleic acid-binding, OB-fold protein [Artemisia annua]|uniref:Nucleic acid-binding, OB-fold protein n=1 Tax=Artemisia annua TaxID=35608 RepID=A0A2U1KFY8_ARTAN|nr:nucleic acid-binding, OB-fold protein [Artemisia annua]